MTELVLKGKISRKKIKSMVDFLNSWGIEVEIKEAPEEEQESIAPFTETFGMWKGRDMNIKEIREKNLERRTKTYGDDSL
jgi:hypothetical protein